MLHYVTAKVNTQFRNLFNATLATIKLNKLLLLKALFLLAFSTSTLYSNAQLSGIKTVGTGKNYSNIAAAIADLNASGVGSGGVTFNVDAGHTETFASPSAGLITATGTLINPIIFQKIGTGANPLITAATGVSNIDGIITIAGGDFITIDAIDVQEKTSNASTNSLMESGYAILKGSATDGAKSTTIKNCNITLKSGSGIYIANHLATSNSGLTITDTAGRHTNIVILNNTIKNVTEGITANSNTSGIFDTWLQLIGNHIQVFTSYGIHQNYQTFSVIKGNRLENATAYAGMRIWQCNNSTITENVIYKLSGNAINYGAITTFYNTNLVLANNIIDSIVYTTSLYYGCGIYTYSGSDSIYNNKISRIYAPNGVTNLAVCGIQTNTNSKIFNNTIFLDCSSGGDGFGSNAIVSGSSLDLRNNILYNTSTHGITAAIRLTGSIANYNANSNNNLFYAGTPAATNLLFTVGANNLETIDALKSFLTTRDQKSVSDLVNFISTTSSDNDYLKIDTSIPTIVESRGQKIIGIDDDFNTVGIRKTYPKVGQLNGGGTLPDIGAVEFDGMPFTEFTVGAGKDYSTIAAAIAYLNTNALAGKYVTFDVSANHTETFASPTAGLITATGVAGSSIVFRKSGAGTNPKITAATGTGILDGIIVISGGDYITFDGIDVQENASNTNSTAQMEWGYAILKSSATNGAKNITIKNCSVTLNKANTSTRGIYIHNHTPSSNSNLSITNTAGIHENILIDNNTVSNAYEPIHATGHTTAGFYDVGLIIQNNTVSNYNGSSITSAAIATNNQASPTVQLNNISNSAGATGQVFGIYSNSPNSNISRNTILSLISGGSVHGINATSSAIIEKNKVADLTITGTGDVAGIRKQGVTTTGKLINNIIGNLHAPNANTQNAVVGMYAQGDTVFIYHNTIYVNCTAGTAGFGSNCLYVNTGGKLILRNNILYNASTYGIVKALRFSNTTLTNYHDSSNNNLFYAGVPSANNLIYSSNDNAHLDQTLAAFKTRLGNREQNSITDTVTFISTDENNVNFLKINTEISSILESAGQKIAGIDDDYTTVGVRASYPKINQLNGGGKKPDIGADEFDGTPANALSGAFTVGAGKNYATIAAAITDINLRGIGAGGVIFNVDAGHTETFSSAKSGLITATGTALKPVEFKKTGAGANPIITAGIGTGSLDGVIVIAGGDYITFDGIDVQENVLNTTITTRMEWGYAMLNSDETNGVKYVTIKNCAIQLNKAYSASRGIYVKNHTNASITNLAITDNSGRHNNIVLNNNTLSNVYRGIYCEHNGNNQTAQTNFEIVNNYVTDFGDAGIYLHALTSALVQSNTIENSTGSTYGIYTNWMMTPASTISKNIVRGLTSTGTIYGCYLATNGTNTIAVKGNKVYNIVSSSTSGIACGIFAWNITVSNNLVSDIHAPNSNAAYAVRGISGGYSYSYHNTVYLNCSSAVPAFSSTAFYHTYSASVRNNVFINNSTSGKKVAIYNENGLANYNTSNNTNLLYAGTPSVDNLLYVDATNNIETLANLKTIMVNREQGSLSDSVSFLSFDGSSADFLHINPAIPTVIESAGIKISGFNNDFNSDVIRTTYPQTGQTRGWGKAPDLGAVEFDGTRVPTITSFTPNTAASGATVTITGTNLWGATSVKFGGTNASSFTVVSATSITAVVATGTSGVISITTPGGTATSGSSFTFIPAPTITSFTPNTAASGATVTITGTNLWGATSVKFGGTNASSFTVVSATSITAVVATGTSGVISITTPGGTATSGSSFTFIKTLSGTYTVGAGKIYPTIAAAISEVNASIIGGAITFDVSANHTETFASPTAGLITATGVAGSSIVFRKSGAGANPKITAATGTGILDGIIVISGGDYITFDGIDVQENASNINSTAQMEWGYAILKSSETNGAKNITIKNCSVTLNKANTSTRGIYIHNHTPSSNSNLSITNTLGIHENILIDNNTVSNAYEPIHATGHATAGYNDVGLIIQNNTVSNYNGSSITSAGISINGQAAPIVRANAISNSVGATEVVYGIFTNSANTLISKNRVFNLVSNGNVHGIYASAETVIESNIVANLTITGTSDMSGIRKMGASIPATIYNNVIQNITAPNSTNTNGVLGMYVQGVVNVYHNTIYLNCTSGGVGFGSSCIYSNTTGVQIMRNNILYNASTYGEVRALRRNTTNLSTFHSSSNNNLYYVGTPSSTNLVYSNQDNATHRAQTLEAFKAILGDNREKNSYNESLLFIDIDSLRPAMGNYKLGASIVGYEYDITGVLRSNPPDIGAYEGREANRWIGGTSNNWNMQSNWDDSVVPVGTISLNIDSNTLNHPALNNNLTLNNLYIPEGKTMDINGKTLTINGEVSGNGSLKGGATSSLVINGTGNGMQIKFDSSTARLKNLTINRGSSPTSGSVVLGNKIGIVESVTMVNGTLNANNNLILLSDASGTAYIGTIPVTADVIGNVTAQRYIPAVTRRSRLLASPLQNYTHLQLLDNMYITGPGGATNGFDVSPSNGNTIYTYQESTVGGRGWKPISNIYNTLNSAQGASVFIRGDRSLTNWWNTPYPAQNQITIDFSNQPINKGNISPLVTYTNTGYIENDGWNLIGNPYPSPINWKNVSKTNLSPFYYSFDVVSGSYVAALGDTLIASGQAFFVQAIGPNPTITFTENSKQTSAPRNYFKTANSKINARMIKDAFNSDLLSIVFAQGADSNYQVTEDAIKMTNSVVNFSSIENNNDHLLQYNTRPLLTNKTDTVKLYVEAANGTYTLNFDGIETVDNLYSVILHDAFTNSTVNLRLISNYTFTITSSATSKGASRFKIIFTEVGVLPVQLASFEGQRAGLDAKLKWTTASEKNSSYFVVERSNDKNSWQELGFVNAKGKSAVLNNYGYTDVNAFEKPALYYYRLKQVDQNNAIAYSQMISLNNKTVIADVVVYPTPTRNLLNIKTNLENGSVLIELSDAMGKVVMQKEIEKFGNEVQLDMSDLRVGVYLLKYNEGGIETIKKVIKQ